jgi:hypothetical protein
VYMSVISFLGSSLGQRTQIYIANLLHILKNIDIFLESASQCSNLAALNDRDIQRGQRKGYFDSIS